MLIPKLQKISIKSRIHLRKDVLPSEIMNLLLSEYRINLLISRKINERDHVHDTCSYLIETDKGKLILREHIRNTSRDALLYEHSLLDYLFRKHLKVAKPLVTSNGETFIEINNKYYTLFEFIPGYFYSDYFFKRKDKIKHIQQAAEALGRIHNIVREFNPEGQKSWRNFRETKKSLETFYENIRDKHSKDDFDMFFLNNFRFLNDKLSELGEFFTSFNKIPKCIIHEDFGPYNLLFRNGKLYGILDFMDAHLDYRAKDVIFSLSVFTATRKSYYDKELVKIFLKSYESFCDVTEKEVDLMSDLLCLKRLKELPTFLMAHYLENGNDSKYQVMFNKFVREIQWHQQNKKMLTEQLKNCIKSNTMRTNFYE